MRNRIVEQNRGAAENGTNYYEWLFITKKKYYND